MTAAELREKIAGCVITDVRDGRVGGIEMLLAGERDGAGEILLVVLGAAVTADIRVI